MSLGRTKGSAVRLAEPRDGVPLFFGEGVETTVTAMQATGYPGFATLGTSNLKAVDPPDGAKDVILLGGNDDGKSAAAIAKIAPGLKQKGIRVRVAYPPAGFKDWAPPIELRPLRRCARRSRTPRTGSAFPVVTAQKTRHRRLSFSIWPRLSASFSATKIVWATRPSCVRRTTAEPTARRTSSDRQASGNF
jgi:hypothetical protein